MKPAFSIIVFTTCAGVGQGAAVALAVATLLGAQPGAAFTAALLWSATALLLVGLAASFFHLGHPLRAWRAALMWRTSWMSREVIVLPACMGLVGAWALLATFGLGDPALVRVLAWLTLASALVLWYCTAMIYACIRFIQEWAHPLTIVNYMLLGLSSGLVASCALAVLAHEPRFAASAATSAFVVTALAWITRSLSLRRNARLKPKSTTQTATGIAAARVVQTSMGLTGGSFNTREFFHGASARVVRKTRLLFQVFAFAVPLGVLALGAVAHQPGLWLLAFPLQFAGLLAERWFFFAQARHPQNIYYQVVS